MTVDEFAALAADAGAWCERARADGWLDEADAQHVRQVELHTPAELFQDEQTRAAARQRPLVVAFFGGTGVGKSSLLNRLAARPIARTGVERPTSHEVTLYVHESIALASLPEMVPAERVRIERHAAPQYRDVVWLDMPDMDSAVRENRGIALAWLPYVDLVLYVVSPERYRDDAGWRLLQQRGARHGWVFILNRSDEGDPSQRDDLTRLLEGAGFEQPLVLTTCCLESAGADGSLDEFEQLHALLRDLNAQHGAAELERLGFRARLVELAGSLRGLTQRVPAADSWRELIDGCRRDWQAACALLAEGLDWSLRLLAARLVTRERSRLDALIAAAGGLAVLRGGRALQLAAGQASSGAPQSAGDSGVPAQQNPEGGLLASSVWDAWSQRRLEAQLDAIEVRLREAHVRPDAVRPLLESAIEPARERVVARCEERLRISLAQPGSRWRRALRRVTGFLMVFLPLVALALIGYVVVTRFFSAAVAGGAFLGLDFAVNAALVLLVSWGLPFWLDRLLMPSLEQVALEALRAGLREVLEEIGEELIAALEARSQDAEQLRNEAAGLIERMEQAAQQAWPASGVVRKLVARPPQPAARA